MNDKAKLFGHSIYRLIAGEDLSREQTRDLFAEILRGEQTDIHQGAFLSAITAKGPSPREIAGAWQAIYDLDTVKVSPNTPKPLLDNCGTGMDSFKTFNISTCSGIVAARAASALPDMAQGPSPPVAARSISGKPLVLMWSVRLKPSEKALKQAVSDFLTE